SEKSMLNSLWCTSVRTVRAVAVLAFLGASLQAQSQFQILYGFKGGTDGGGVWDSVTFDQQGNLYGTTRGGGAYGYGTVFQLSPDSGGTWFESVLHSFPLSTRDASAPTGNLVFDSVGNLYGTAPYVGKHDLGDVFELSPTAFGTWTESVIYIFGTNRLRDGAFPYSGLSIDQEGNLYGTTPNTVYELTPGPNGWTEHLLHMFCTKPVCHDGSLANAGVIVGPDGSLYGVTEGGGPFHGGTTYELRHTSTGWKESLPYSFGSFPKDGSGGGLGDLAMDDLGNLYGATIVGGGTNALCTGGCGTVYKLTPGPGSQWKETILYNLQGGTAGFRPVGVAVDSLGNVYGTTIAGGDPLCSCGVVYKVAPDSTGTWTYSVLHTFVGSDGAQPDANMVLYNGNLYGTTATGGPGGAGVVFEITP
ncbi:MAG TPA: choice-of-anchor tandem repeat GloVer-containing protein, partial [Candidatus Sulfotelmatobacter sp.]